MRQFTPFLLFISYFIGADHTSVKAQLYGYDWAKTVNGTTSEKIVDIVTAKNNFIYACGNFNSASVQVGSNTLTNKGYSDVFVVKYDTTGTIIWAKNFGGSGNDEVTAIATDSLGNIYLTGNMSGSTSFGLLSFTGGKYIAKINNAGDAIWIIEPVSNDGAVFDIAADSSGNTVICGSFRNTCTIGDITLTATINNDGFVAKFNTNGSFIWAKQVYSTKPAQYANYSSANDTCVSLAIAPNGRIGVIGNTHGAQQLIISNGTSIDATFTTTLSADPQFDYYSTIGFIMQLDADGGLLWIKDDLSSVNSGKYVTTAQGLATNANAELYVSYENVEKGVVLVYFNYKAAVNKYSNTGARLWTRTVAASTDFFYNIGVANTSIAIDDSKVYVADKEAYTSIDVGFHPQEYKITCLNDAGITQWKSVYHNTGIGIEALAAKGTVYACGFLSTNTLGNLTVINSGSYDGFVARLKTTPLLPFVFSQVLPDKTICLGGSTYIGADTLASGGALPYRYSWLHIGGPSNTLSSTTVPNPLASPAVTTTYVLTITDAIGSTLHDMVKVTVAPPGAPTPTITSNGPLSICDGDTVVLSSSPALTYIWSNGDSIRSIGITRSGKYWVKVGNGGTCNSLASDTVTVALRPKPATPLITQLGNTLSSTAATNNQWYLNGTPIIGATNQTYTYNTAGTYTVKVTNGNGCSNSAAPYNAMLMITNPGEDEGLFSQRIAPNPVTQQATIRYELNSTSTVSVYIVNNQQERIITLVNQQRQAAGIYTYPVNQSGKGLQKGNYYVVYIINAKRRVEPIVVL